MNLKKKQIHKKIKKKKVNQRTKTKKKFSEWNNNQVRIEGSKNYNEVIRKNKNIIR
jgi:hypothetical protein